MPTNKTSTSLNKQLYTPTKIPSPSREPFSPACQSGSRAGPALTVATAPVLIRYHRSPDDRLCIHRDIPYSFIDRRRRRTWIYPSSENYSFAKGFRGFDFAQGVTLGLLIQLKEPIPNRSRINQAVAIRSSSSSSGRSIKLISCRAASLYFPVAAAAARKIREKS